MNLLAELKRRNVLRAGVLYAGAVWALSQGLAQLLPLFGSFDWVARWFLIAGIIGFPFWLAFAWFYEFTPQGLKRESEIDPGDSVAHRTSRKLDFAIIGVLAVAVVLLLTDRLVTRQVPAIAVAKTALAGASAATATTGRIPDKSIAVLPFRNQGGKADEQYFSDGLSEDLITTLSKFDGLKVIARDSAFRFRDSKLDSKAIASQLGVAHLLSGSVRRLGDTVRISASLVNADDGSSRWAQNYDRPYKDLFALQDDITKAVSGELHARLMPTATTSSQGDRPPSGNLAAHEAVLKGNFEYAQSNAAAMRRAIVAYEQAIALDPAYAYAYARMARAQIQLMSNYANASEEGIAKARQAVTTALRLEPDSAEAHKARASMLKGLDNDLAGATRESKRALVLAPNDPEALIQLANMQAAVGELAASQDSYRRALALDPLSDVAGYDMALNWLGMGAYDQAAAMLQRMISQQPDASSNRAFLAVAQLKGGHTAEAVATARSEPNPFWRTWALALAYWANGDHAQSDAALQQLIKEDADDAGSQIAMIYAQRGDADQVFKWLEHAHETGDTGVTEMRFDAFLAPYRQDPRFIVLARKLGLMPENPAPVANTDAKVDRN